MPCLLRLLRCFSCFLARPFLLTYADHLGGGSRPRAQPHRLASRRPRSGRRCSLGLRTYHRILQGDRYAAPPTSDNFRTRSWNEAVQATAKMIVAALDGVAATAHLSLGQCDLLRFDCAWLTGATQQYVRSIPLTRFSIRPQRCLRCAHWSLPVSINAMGLTGAGVHVAVVDTGDRIDNPDLQSSIVAQHCFCREGSGCPNGTPEQDRQEVRRTTTTTAPSSAVRLRAMESWLPLARPRMPA